MLIAIVQLVAEETGIAARLLATRADAEEAARTVDTKGIEAARALPAFSTWRRAVLGDTGRLAGRPDRPRRRRRGAARHPAPIAGDYSSLAIRYGFGNHAQWLFTKTRPS